jgi:hypothetical protein
MGKFAEQWQKLMILFEISILQILYENDDSQKTYHLNFYTEIMKNFVI